MAVWLVTGGAGFIGSCTVRSLVEDGETVRVLDDFSSGRRDNLAGMVAPDGPVELVEGSILDRDRLGQALPGATYVVHLAAQPSVVRSVEDPEETHAVNATGTLRVLLAARRHGVRRVVLASSAAVYGEDPTLPKHEDLPTAPVAPYAASKVAAEAYAQVASASLGLEAVSLRLFNVYGPRQDPGSQYASVIPCFVDCLRRRIPPTVHGDGRQTRDFVSVGDVVRAIRLACITPGLAGQVLNVASGRQTDLLALLEVLRDALPGAPDPVHEAPRAGDLRHSVADVTRARELLGFEAEVGLATGLRQTAEWIASQEAP